MTDEPEERIFGFPVKLMSLECITCGNKKEDAMFRFIGRVMKGPYCDPCAKEAELKDEMDKYRRLD